MQTVFVQKTIYESVLCCCNCFWHFNDAHIRNSAGCYSLESFFHEGVQEALYSNVERIEQEDNSRDLHYSVVVNGEQQEWEVICLQTTCIARRLSE